MFHKIARGLLLCGFLTGAFAGGPPALAEYYCRADPQGGCVDEDCWVIGASLCRSGNGYTCVCISGMRTP